jgi:hypothetical protein
MWSAILGGRYNGNIVESGVKHHNHNLINAHLVSLITLAASANVRLCLDFQKGISETSFIYCFKGLENLSTRKKNIHLSPVTDKL